MVPTAGRLNSANTNQLLEKLTVSQPVKKLPAVCGIVKFLMSHVHIITPFFVTNHFSIILTCRVGAKPQAYQVAHWGGAIWGGGAYFTYCIHIYTRMHCDGK